jgi:predicted DNA-binding protein
MADHMIRKQFRLSRRQNLKLQQLAKQRGTNEAEVIRQALEHEMELSDSVIKKNSKQALNNIIAYARSLRKRPEHLRGRPHKFNREELYKECDTT